MHSLKFYNPTDSYAKFLFSAKPQCFVCWLLVFYVGSKAVTIVSVQLVTFLPLLFQPHKTADVKRDMKPKQYKTKKHKQNLFIQLLISASNECCLFYDSLMELIDIWVLKVHSD